MERYLKSFLQADLDKKMVFLGGPRQVGKTTLAKEICAQLNEKYQYFNWDRDEDRRAIRQSMWRDDAQLVVFDELHKYPRWKNWIKGVYDSRPEHQQYLVTGSARLDIYKRGGDSLLGRYHYWRLHPLTLDEIPADITPEDAYQRLLTVGGFPEPFFENDLREAKRWRRERFDRIIREDIRDLESIRNVQLLSLFIDALRERVSSGITLSNIARDLEISPTTAKAWLNIAERMYLGFSVSPLTSNVMHGIKKQPKFYFYDNADVIEGADSGARLENLVATSLLKRLHFLEDYYGSRCSLHYIRDKENREVDFVTVIDKKVHDLIEVKRSDSSVTTALKYYQKLLAPQNTVQIVGNLAKPFHQESILVTNPIDYFQSPPWLAV